MLSIYAAILENDVQESEVSAWKIKMNLPKKIIFYKKEIHFSAVRRYLKEDLLKARSSNLSYEEFLCCLLQKEYDARI